MSNSQKDNIEHLLMPITEAQPSGSSIRYELISKKFTKGSDRILWYDAIQNAMREDVYEDRYRVEAPLVANWKLVSQYTTDILLNHSKDLQVASWYCIAHINNNVDKFESISDGLYLITKLVERYWPSLYPNVQPEDESENDYLDRRAGTITLHDSKLSTVLLGVPLLEPQTQSLISTGDGSIYRFNLENYQKLVLSRKLRQPSDSDQSNYELANDSVWQEAAKDTRSDFINHAIDYLEKSISLIDEFNDNIEKHYLNDTPTLYQVRFTLQEMINTIERYVPNVVNSEDTESISIATQKVAHIESFNERTVPLSAFARTIVEPGVTTRKELFIQLNEISKYFKIHEPHSPVSYLIDRAIRWGNIPLNDWLREAFNENEDTVKLARRLEDLLGIMQNESTNDHH
jgi:type VI secretion system protein ImpA